MNTSDLYLLNNRICKFCYLPGRSHYRFYFREKCFPSGSNTRQINWFRTGDYAADKFQGSHLLHLTFCFSMHLTQASNRSHIQSLSLILILSCLFGSTLGQTFQYSRGWTNGKKRSSMGPFLIQDMNEGQEVFGLCQMQRLKEIWENRRLDRDYLPCEVIDKPEMEIMERLRRKGDCDRSSILDSLPPQPN